MKWVAATVSIKTGALTNEIAVEIIADLFYGLGLKGVVINETETGEDGEAFLSVTGYFPRNASLVENKSQLEASIKALPADGLPQCAVAYQEIDEEDWADSWKAHFHPQRIGRHIVVKPSWRDYKTEPDDVVIEIDPGMAFGTGTHATTRMCLIMLERYFEKGMTFLDVGTGSGILMIAAFRLGANAVRGVDNDPIAVEIARSNLTQNRVPLNMAGILSANLIDGVRGTFDLVCANILAEVVVDLIPDINRVLAPGGLFVCSGIIESKSRGVENQLQKFGFDITDRMTDETWVCLAAVAEGAGG